MSNLLNVEGKTYTAAAVAGKQFGYSKDYLLLLIKGGKIDGRKVGNKWYVHVPSAQLFFKDAEVKREERRKQISLERKSELQEHLSVKLSGHHKTALVETFAILIIGLSLGAAGYMGTASQAATVSGNTFTFFEKVAVTFHSFLSSEAPEEVAPDEALAVDDASEGEHSPVFRESEGFVVAPADEFSAESAASLRASFSDPVEVRIDPENPDTGIVIPEFKEEKGEPYRFLLVPMSLDPG